MTSISKEIKMNTFEFALELAKRAHAGQVDKAGKPYIDHVIRVANSFSNHADPALEIIAVLHDILEDTWVTKEMIENLFGNSIAICVDALTRRENESYSEFITRIVCTSTRACKVKVADLEDNMNLGRLKEVTDADIARVKKYDKARSMLKDHISEVTSEYEYEDVY